MKKYYVLDTNVLLHDPMAINHFQDNNVIIPLKVLSELDQFKRELNERGRNARQVSRMLDELRQKARLSDPEGVPLENGGNLRVVFPEGDDPFACDLDPDDIILKTALKIQDSAHDIPCVMVSKDINLRLKADAIGLQAEDYENGHSSETLEEMYTGRVTLEVDGEVLRILKQDRKIDSPFDKEELWPNQYLTLVDRLDRDNALLGRYDAGSGQLIAIRGTPDAMSPIGPRNVEQQFALDALLDDRIKVVTLLGKAGTGKTLLAVAAGVYKTLDANLYKKLLISRPTVSMGKGLGFLPGSLQEKLDPWMQPIYDALDLVKHGRYSQSKHDKKGQGPGSFSGNDSIAVEALSYIRGRSIPKQFFIIDESQNLTPLEVKTVITRVGRDTKIVFTGDINQIDNPYIDSMSNGLTAVAEGFKGESVAAHVKLDKGVRSEVAELAANLL